MDEKLNSREKKGKKKENSIKNIETPGRHEISPRKFYDSYSINNSMTTRARLVVNVFNPHEYNCGDSNRWMEWWRGSGGSILWPWPMRTEQGT